MAADQEINAGWEKSSKKPDMLLAHFSRIELGGLDTIQGKTSLDPATGLREYSALDNLIKIPKIRKEVIKLAQPVCEATRTDYTPPEIEKQYRTDLSFLKDTVPQFFKKTPVEKESRPIDKMEEMGIDGDNRLAFVPLSFVKLAMEIGYHPEFNPNTNLLMFGSVGKSILRVAAPIAAVAAAPFTGGTSLGLLGMAATAAGASALAHVATGTKLKDALKPALISGATAGLGGWGSGVTGWSPALTQGLARTAIGMGTGEKFQDAAMQGLMQGAVHHGIGKIGESFGPSSPKVPSASAYETAVGNMPQASSESFGSKVGNLFKNPIGGMGPFLPLVAMGALSYKGQKEAYDHEKKKYEEDLEKERRMKGELGHHLPWRPVRRQDIQLRPNPNYGHEPGWAQRIGAFESPFLEEGQTSSPYPPMPYHKGGHVKHDQNKVQSIEEGVLVKGPGKGQQDLIKTSVPENSYIIDASATSMFGDGSSDAGAKVLKEFEQEVKKKFHPTKTRAVAHHLKTTTRQLPVWLSDSEYKFSPLTVTVLGKGSPSKGASLLKNMVENIRQEKSKKGGGLPLKAKSPWHYLEDRR